MNVLLQGIHPTFDALSAYADASDLSAARSRVGRHVARCLSCSATVEEIRALGDAARAVELPGAPEGIWPAIERALAAGDRASDADQGRGASLQAGNRTGTSPVRPASPGAPSGPGMRGAVSAALAVAAIVGVMLLVPSTRSARLQASPNVGRWRFSPARPIPGGRVQARFEPVAGTYADSALLLIGSTPRRADDPVVDPYMSSGLEDSLGILRRGNDGAYAGAFTFPASSRTMVVHLVEPNGRSRPRVMSTSGPMTRTPEAAALLVAGDAQSKPSLAALTEAAYLWPGQASVSFIVSDTLIRYFPDEPIGYAVDRRVASGGVIDALIAWFRRGERQYGRFDRAFMSARKVSVDHEMAMITFANRIDEPGEVRKWTMRLAQDHPEDPRTLYVYASLLHGMLSRDGTIDSVRRALPFADSLWERNGHRGAGIRIADVARTVGDRASQRKWTIRGLLDDARDVHGSLLGLDDESRADLANRAMLEAPLRRRVSMACVVPAGKYPRWTGLLSWESVCASNRSWAYAALSSLARLEGRATHALSLADSSIAISDSIGRCGSVDGRRRRGEALLDLGDTAQAIPDLAAGLGYANWQSRLRRDSLGVRLRSFIAPEAWAREAALADGRLMACMADRNGGAGQSMQGPRAP